MIVVFPQMAVFVAGWLAFKNLFLGNEAIVRGAVEAARKLSYRAFLIVVLIVNKRDVFPDQWIYIHDPRVQVGRVQNFKNWSPEMVSDPELSFIGLEYFVNRGDDLWRRTDDELIRLGTAEAETIGLLDAREVQSGTVVRMPRAYPVYDDGYEGRLQVVREWLDGFENLHTVGRNGQHRYTYKSIKGDFTYDENVYAGYISYQRAINEKWSLSTGLRAEQTDSRGDLQPFLPELQEEGDLDAVGCHFAKVAHRGSDGNRVAGTDNGRVDHDVAREGLLRRRTGIVRAVQPGQQEGGVGVVPSEA